MALHSISGSLIPIVSYSECAQVTVLDPAAHPVNRAYFHSASTLNCIRSLLASGFADLHNPRSWSLSHVRNPDLARSFESIIERLEDSLDFLKVIGGESGSLSSVDLYTSHEVMWHSTRLAWPN